MRADDRVTDLAAQLSALGPYFAITAGVDGPQWRPLEALPAALDERVSFVRGELARRAGAPVEARVAASIHQLGFASRLVAPALGTLALRGVVPEFAGVHWQPVDGGPVPIAVTGVKLRGGDVAAFAEAVVEPLVAPVVEAFAEVGVSRRVLWGNVASALAGAASMLRRSGERLAVDPVEFAGEVLTRPGPLAGAGRFEVDGRFFVRRSCCLFYRVPHAGKCGDCVLL